MPMTDRAIRRTVDQLLYVSEGVGILGVDRRMPLTWLPEEEREPMPRRGRAPMTRATEVVVAEPGLSDFQRRQAIRKQLGSYFDYSNELVAEADRGAVNVLRYLLQTEGVRCIHNGNVGTLRTLLKSHRISHIERMTPEELKSVAQAVVERDTTTIQTVEGQAATRRA